MQSNIKPQTFIEYVFKNKRNKATILLAFAAIIIQFSIFKYFYPYAGFIHDDSFVYLDTAYLNLDINTYMVGYSRFLRIFSVFSNSDTALVAFQYLLIQVSALYFLFTLFYFYRPGKLSKFILLCFMVLNPLFLYMANLISSDSFFLALSMVWFTILIWIVHRPNVRLIAWHTLVIFIAFTVRYNALIYLFIASIAFILSRQPLAWKLGGIVAGLIAIGSFVLYTGNKYQTLTGTWQYSPFGGWQLTNNAMYAYRYVNNVDRKPSPARFKELDNMIRAYFDSTKDVKKNPQEALMASTVYMWDPRSTLYKYRNKLFEKDSSATELKKWASMGPLYADYGTWLIKQYPLTYARYFLWPNANKYYAPPVEFLSTYNMGKNDVEPIAQVWFRFKSQKVITRTKDLNVNALKLYPILTGIMNVVFFTGFIFYFILNDSKSNTLFRKGVILAGTVWLLNAVFSILSTAAALRFLAFPILLMSTFSLLLIDYIIKSAVTSSVSNVSIKAIRK